MASSLTLLSLKTQVRQRADMVGSKFVSDSELTSYINVAGAKLHDLLIQQYGNEYFGTTSSIATVAGTQTYALPSDFYKLLGVDLLISGVYGSDSAVYSTLDPYQFVERNNYNNAIQNVVSGNYPQFRYRTFGQYLRFIRVEGGRTIQLHYIPTYTKLVNDADLLDGVNGFEDIIIIDATIKCKSKQEDDVQYLKDELNDSMERIKAMAAIRDVGQSERTSDVTARNNQDQSFGGYEF